MTKHSSQGGFSLLELIAAIAIVAILAFLAVPSFDNFSTKNRVETLQNRFATAIVTARAEAASRNSLVSVCALELGDVDDAEKCQQPKTLDESASEADKEEAKKEIESAWSNGWAVFTDQDGSGQIDGENEVIVSFRNTTGFNVIYNGGGTVTFNNQGFNVTNTRTSAIFCDKRGKFGRGIIILNSGRVIRSRSADASGIHKIEGAQISCS